MKILIEINYESIRNDVLKIENSGNKYYLFKIRLIITLQAFILKNTSTVVLQKSGTQ